MRRSEKSVLTPTEREELERMLTAILFVQEAMRSFEDGEINLRDAIGQMVAAVSVTRAA